MKKNIKRSPIENSNLFFFFFFFFFMLIAIKWIIFCIITLIITRWSESPLPVQNGPKKLLSISRSNLFLKISHYLNVQNRDDKYNHSHFCTVYPGWGKLWCQTSAPQEVCPRSTALGHTVIAALPALCYIYATHIPIYLITPPYIYIHWEENIVPLFHDIDWKSIFFLIFMSNFSRRVWRPSSFVSRLLL